MPRSVETTCDVCGKAAHAYPSFFEIRNANEGKVVWAGVGSLMKNAPRKPEYSTRGSLRPGLTLFLCGEHFKSLEAACERWFAGVQKEQQVVSR